MQDFAFILLAAAVIVSSFLAVTLSNLLHAALAFMGSLFFTAGIYLLMQAEFLAISQVLVYIGGIVIFIVFTIFLTTGLGEKCIRTTRFIQVSAVFTAVLIFCFFVSIVSHVKWVDLAVVGKGVTLEQIGVRLLSVEQSGFVVPFEILSVLLLATVIGAVVIARRDNELEPER